MLNAILVVLGVIGISIVVVRRLSRQATPGPNHTDKDRSATAVWLDRLESVQLIGIVVAVAAVPLTFIVMVATGSTVITGIVMGGVLAGGVIFGLCEIAKGVIEARDILKGNDIEN